MTILAPVPPGAVPLLPLAPNIPGVRGQRPRPVGRKASELPIKQTDAKRPKHLSFRRMQSVRVTRPKSAFPQPQGRKGRVRVRSRNSRAGFGCRSP
ncbi:conserved hypothetical protein [Citreicella sp. SE45]|nr:conserved hypothetical protein [Citreicella sp. SE45]